MQTSKKPANILFLRDRFEPKPIAARIIPGMDSQRDANRPHSGRRGASDAEPGGLTATIVNVVVTGVEPSARDDGENEHSASAGETEQVNATELLSAPFWGVSVMTSGACPPPATSRAVARFSV